MLSFIHTIVFGVQSFEFDKAQQKHIEKLKLHEISLREFTTHRHYFLTLLLNKHYVAHISPEKPIQVVHIYRCAHLTQADSCSH